jgi:hypothetical protein
MHAPSDMLVSAYLIKHLIIVVEYHTTNLGSNQPDVALHQSMTYFRPLNISSPSKFLQCSHYTFIPLIFPCFEFANIDMISANGYLVTAARNCGRSFVYNLRGC